ncbi:hypothetical protein TD95_004263 [Thielaviopsis punctulata]|uniref:SGNH hydrolase-type esterase domain-containing protein n=1 Tax=Thielaviopsis punctulata TaxID=72032 RepID=A0A0F4Z7S8_9PEZI|nr:hypothetical protein TD95_004263 [Thielaviopsis punctulata]
MRLPSLLRSVTAAALSISLSVTAAPVSQAVDLSTHWVATWTSMPQQVEPNNLPPAPYNSSEGQFVNATLRQTLHMSIGAETIRIQISNTFGATPLTISAASLALPTNGSIGVGSIDTTTLQPLTFNGSDSVTIPAGTVVYSDPAAFPVLPQSMLSVSLYLATGQSGAIITGHPGSRTTSWMQPGNHVSSASLTAASTEHWYFLTAVEAHAPASSSALVILGDSLTDGRGSITDANTRWPDFLLRRLQASNNTRAHALAVVNEAAGGNAVLSGGLGPPLMTRYQRDALGVRGVSHVMIFEGVNDIGPAPDTTAGADAVADGLIAAYKTIIAACKAQDLMTIGATITPFQGPGQAYSGVAREAARQKVNKWILESGAYDYVVDFSKAVSDGDKLIAAYDSGDHLHMNPAGYENLASVFDLETLVSGK